MPLQCIAQAYLKLGCPDLIQQAEMREAVVTITVYMNAHPEMIERLYELASTEIINDNLTVVGE